MTMVHELDAQVIRPRTQLFRRLHLAVAVLAVPVFGVLLWLSLPFGWWPWVVGVALVAAVIYAIGMLSTRSVYFRLYPWGVEDHVPFGLTRRVRAEDVDTVLLIDLYGSGMETRPHLFAVDAHDRLLLRMHGQVWTRSSIQQVAAKLGAPVVHAPTPMTLAEFSSIEPQLLPWWERRPLLRRHPRRRAADEHSRSEG